MIEEHRPPDNNSSPPASGDIDNQGNQSDDASQGSNIASSYGDDNPANYDESADGHSDQGDRDQSDNDQGDREGRPYNTPSIVRATLAVAPSRLTAELPRLVPIFETGLIVAGLYAMLEWLPLRVFSDGDVRLFAIYYLVHHHTLSHMAYSIIGPAFSIPLVIVDKFTPTMYWWQKHYNVFLLAAAMLLAYVALRKKIDHSLLRRFFLVLL